MPVDRVLDLACFEGEESPLRTVSVRLSWSASCATWEGDRCSACRLEGVGVDARGLGIVVHEPGLAAALDEAGACVVPPGAVEGPARVTGRLRRTTVAAFLAGEQSPVFEATRIEPGGSPEEVVICALPEAPVTLTGTYLAGDLTCTKMACLPEEPCCNSCTGPVLLSGADLSLPVLGRSCTRAGGGCALDCPGLELDRPGTVTGHLVPQPSMSFGIAIAPG